MTLPFAAYISPISSGNNNGIALCDRPGKAELDTGILGVASHMLNDTRSAAFDTGDTIIELLRIRIDAHGLTNYRRHVSMSCLLG